jgi:hypothetical protein
MNVPKNREKDRKKFTSPEGLSFLSKVAGGTKTTPTTVRKVTPLYDQEKDK